MQSVNLVQAEQNSALRARVAELEGALDGALFSIPTLSFWNGGCFLQCPGLDSPQWTEFPSGMWSVEELIHEDDPDGLGLLLRGNNGPFVAIVFPTDTNPWLRLGTGDDDVIECNAWLVDRLLDELEPMTKDEDLANKEVWSEFKRKARTIAKCKQ